LYFPKKSLERCHYTNLLAEKTNVNIGHEGLTQYLKYKYIYK